MPFRKRVVRKKRAVSRRAPSALSIKNARKLGKIGIPETKHHDEAIGSIELSTDTALFTLLNGVTQGDDNNERIGDSIRMKSINWHLVITPGDDRTTVRLAVVLVKQGSAVATPVLTDIWENSTPTSFKNFNKMTKTKILWQRIFQVPPRDSAAVEAGTAPCYRTISGSVSFDALARRKKSWGAMRYTEFEESGTDSEKNALYLVHQGSGLIAAGVWARLTGDIRLTFTDP